MSFERNAFWNVIWSFSLNIFKIISNYSNNIIHRSCLQRLIYVPNPKHSPIYTSSRAWNDMWQSITSNQSQKPPTYSCYPVYSSDHMAFNKCGNTEMCTQFFLFWFIIMVKLKKLYRQFSLAIVILLNYVFFSIRRI